MPGLPEQTLHLPFAEGPYRMAMDLVTVPEAAWFELDRLYDADMQERRRLLDTVHDQVFASCPVSDAARTEALALIVSALTAHHPRWFGREGDCLHNSLTGETWPLPTEAGQRSGMVEQFTNEGRGPDPLELAGRLVQEDLCLIQDSADGPMFTAGVVCFPSRWQLTDKIGKPLSAVHGPVPFYAARLEKPVDRFMRHLKVGPIASRLNWSVLDDPALFQPTGKFRLAGGPDITPQNAGCRLFLRVERQTLRRLPSTGAVLFGIRVHRYRLDRIVGRQARAAALAGAVRALPAEILHYKSVNPFRDALLEWLDTRPV